jgi:hypothetical protein
MKILLAAVVCASTGHNHETKWNNHQTKDHRFDRRSSSIKGLVTYAKLDATGRALVEQEMRCNCPLAWPQSSQAERTPFDRIPSTYGMQCNDVEK